MKYKNTKTGAIIDSPCVISGGDWIEEGKEKNDPYDDPYKKITKEQIITILTEKEIEHNPKDSKQVLYDLMKATEED